MQLGERFLGRRKQAGDTIVEVLIAIAVVGLVLITAYVTTNHNTRSVQDAQERSQALELVQSQIEYLRTQHSSADTGSDFCYNAGTKQLKSQATPPNNPCIVNSSGAQAAAADVPAYQLTIHTGDANLYQITATWDSLLSSQQDTVTLYYEVQ